MERISRRAPSGAKPPHHPTFPPLAETTWLNCVPEMEGPFTGMPIFPPVEDPPLSVVAAEGDVAASLLVAGVLASAAASAASKVAGAAVVATAGASAGLVAAATETLELLVC